MSIQDASARKRTDVDASASNASLKMVPGSTRRGGSPVFFGSNSGVAGGFASRRIIGAISQRGHRLDADELIARALRKERRRDFHDRSFMDPLRHLVHSFNEESDLSAFGRRAARIDVMRCLTNLLRLDAAEEADPQIALQPIARPIFITGFPRSGTTFLHSLLAQDPDNAVPRCWQLIHPYPFRSLFPIVDLRRHWVEAQLRIFRLLAPAIDELHPLTSDGPQECTDITAHVFQSLRFDSTYHIPFYQDWIRRHDHADAYRFHRRFLRHLDRQAPGRRWVLKSPDHMYALDAVRAIYPDALFIFLHRDPLRVLASQLNLTETLRRPFTRHVDLKEIGRNVSNAIAYRADRLIANRVGQGVLHLYYRSVTAAPMEAVRQIYAHSGLMLTPRGSERMEQWLAQQKPVAKRRHRRGLSEFGVDAGDLVNRVAHYVQTFDVPRERSSVRSAV